MQRAAGPFTLSPFYQVSAVPAESWTSLVLFYQSEIDAAAVNFGEITIDAADLRLHRHPHRHHYVRGGDQPRIPDRSFPCALIRLRSIRWNQILATHTAA